MALSDHLRAKDWTFSATSRAAQRRNEFALYILVASLGMFFTAGVVGYLIIRLRSGDDAPELRLPPVLWLSTAFAVTGSTLLWRALRSVRRERQRLFRRQLLAAFVFGTAFCISQAIGLSAVFRDHVEAMKSRPAAPPAPQESAEPIRPAVLVPRLGQVPDGVAAPSPADSFPVRSRPQTPPPRLEGLTFSLILLHALHFTGGMICLSLVTYRGLKGRYDHEYHGGVRLCAFYWRFLDVVWIVLFAAFLVTA